MYILKKAYYGIFIYDKVNHFNRLVYINDMCIYFSFQSDFGELDSYKNRQTINAGFLCQSRLKYVHETYYFFHYF